MSEIASDAESQQLTEIELVTGISTPKKTDNTILNHQFTTASEIVTNQENQKPPEIKLETNSQQQIEIKNKRFPPVERIAGRNSSKTRSQKLSDHATVKRKPIQGKVVGRNMNIRFSPCRTPTISQKKNREVRKSIYRLNCKQNREEKRKNLY